MTKPASTAVERMIKQSIWINRPRRDVFDAVTSPDQLTHWLVQRIEPSRSNKHRMRFIWGHNSFEVEFISHTPPGKTVWSWYDKHGVGPRVAFTLVEIKGGTLISLEHTGFDPDETYLDGYVGHVEGWSMYLCNLKCWVEHGIDLRADQPEGTIAM